MSIATGANATTTDDLCNTIEGVAGSIMNVRQAELPQPVVTAAINSEGLSQIVTEYNLLMVAMAYETPVYHNDADKAAASKQFAAERYAVCKEAFAQ